jgi:WD40 repeat protein
MAPEQADGRQDDICPSTDVYALGVMLYELLTGRVPFSAETDVRTLRQIVFDEPDAPRRVRNNVPRDLEAICLKCLEKTPQARYASAGDFARDLGRFLTGHATAARPASVGRKLVNWSRRHSANAALMMVSLLFLFAVAGITSWYRSDLNQAQEDAVQAGYAATQWRQEASQQLNVQTRHAYVDNVNHAYMAWSNARVATALKLLDRCRPGPGEEDERGFEWYYTRRLCEGGLRKMHGHHDRAIHGASFSRDGNRLATCGEDKSIHVWDASTGELLAKFMAHSGCVRDVAFSPDGALLVSVGDDDKLKFWDADTYEQRCVIEPRTGRLHCLVIDHAGANIAVAGDGGKITLWNIKSGERQLVVSADCAAIYSLALAKDGKLAAACSDQTAKIWDLDSPNTPIRVIDSVHTINSVAFSRDGHHLATGGDYVHIWHLDADRPPTFLPGHHGMVHSVAFSADGQLLASTGSDEVIRVWDIATGSNRSYYSHMRPVFDLAFAPRGYWLASVDKGGSIRVWNADGPQDRSPLRMDLQGKDVRLTFSPVGETLAIATGGKRDVSLWRASANGDVDFLDSYSADVPYITSPQCITYSPNGRYLAVATNRDRILLDSDLTLVNTRELDLHGPITHEAAFSVHGLLAESTAGDAGIISLFDAESLRFVEDLDGFRGIAFSPNGNLLATESRKTMFAIELWDLVNRRSVAVMPGHTGQVFSIAFSTDGRTVASGSADGSLRIWDAIHHRETKVMRGHSEGILQVAFSPNQKSVVTSSGDGTLRFWDVLTGRSMLELRVTSGTFRSFGFSADGQVLATAYLAGSNPTEGHVDLWYAPHSTQ